MMRPCCCVELHSSLGPSISVPESIKFDRIRSGLVSTALHTKDRSTTGEHVERGAACEPREKADDHARDQQGRRGKRIGITERTEQRRDANEHPCAAQKTDGEAEPVQHLPESRQRIARTRAPAELILCFVGVLAR